MPPAPRVSIRKKRESHLGCLVAIIIVGSTLREYVVHLDLICKNSGYFREVLQSNRKEIQGECSICHEDLQPAAENIIYCRAQCGVNFHLSCMCKWKQQSPKPMKCPHCRQKWDHTLKTTHSLPDVDSFSFEMYTEWLYHARIRTSPPCEGDCFDELIQAYEMGILFENQDFCNAILHAIVEVIEEDDKYPTPENVALAYGFPDDEDLRELLVDVYMRLFRKKEEIYHAWDILPEPFLQDVFQALMEKAPVQDKTETMEALRSNLPPRVSSDESATGS